ncbi:hypothetical protein [Natronoglomus mannanivorans]|uniref:C2H2-type domain-containing protein n=1 Tax=Natronoglomus mannanivorans TaxID=2979990 RepID=A0AAP2Z440_9EURY|nr:hypothetical protein [Halobacteria archaeon AArc-xg1-1]
MTKVECEYCGESFKEQGLATHQRFCDAAEEDDSQDGAEYSELEEAVLERDGDVCARCEGTEHLVVHQIKPDHDDDQRYLVTLCEECDDELDGLHPRTKRTKIQNG